MSILTGRKINGKQFTLLPMPDEVIRRVELLAPKQDGTPNNITSRDRNKELIVQEWGASDDIDDDDDLSYDTKEEERE